MPSVPSHYGRHGKKKKSHKGLIAVLVVLAVLIGGGAAGAAWYLGSINNAMSLGDKADDIKEALADIVEPDEAFYMLVLGIDAREGAAAERVLMNHPEYAADESHGSGETVTTDTIMLVRVDTKHSKVSLLTIPRDTPYTFKDGHIGKLNSVYSESGATGTIAAVQEITGLDIAHYTEVDAFGLIDLVDGLGGITVDVPIAFEYVNLAGDYVYLDAGVQQINGAQALALSGMRVLYDGKNRDVKRQAAGRQVVQGLLDAILSQPATEIPNTVKNAASCVKTDLSVSEIMDIVNEVGTKVDVITGSGPSAGSADPYVEGEPWLCYVNDDGWNRIIDAFTAGEDIGKVKFKGDVVHYAGQPKETWSEGLVKP